MFDRMLILSFSDLLGSLPLEELAQNRTFCCQGTFFMCLPEVCRALAQRYSARELIFTTGQDSPTTSRYNMRPKFENFKNSHVWAQDTENFSRFRVLWQILICSLFAKNLKMNPWRNRHVLCRHPGREMEKFLATERPSGSEQTA